MIKSIMKPLFGTALAFAALSSLAGCSNSNQMVNDTAHAADTKQSITNIQNDPHIPEQAKAQIIATMQQHGPASPGSQH